MSSIFILFIIMLCGCIVVTVIGFCSEGCEFFGYMGVFSAVVVSFLILNCPIDSKTERIYLKDIPHSSQVYEYKSSDECKEFMYYDGNVQQTLSGDFNLKVFYREDLKESYAEVKYLTSLVSKSGDLQDQEIESIDVYLLK